MNRDTTSGEPSFQGQDALREWFRFGDLRRHPLVIVLVAFAAGIVGARYVPIDPLLSWSVAVAGLVGWRLTCRGSCSAWLLLIAVTATGAAWHQLCWDFFRADELGRFARLRAEPVCLEAIALQRPQFVPARPVDPLCTLPRGDQTQLQIWAVGLRDGTVWQPASGRAVLTVEGHLLAVAPGDRLRIVGQLSRPWPPRNPGQFGFSDRERSQRRLCRVKANHPACVVRRAGTGGWSPRGLVQRAKTRSNELLWRHLGHPRSDLAAAVLLGAREQLERDRVDAFFQTGTIHLLAISGLHVGIMASGFFWVARVSLLPLRIALGTAMACTIFYALLTDARAPVLRAAILVCIICFGWILRRPTTAFNSLAAAALLVLALNPCELFREGAQLSFLAVAVLAWFGPWLVSTSPADPLQRLLDRSRPWPARVARHLGRGVLRLALASALIWLITLPLVMYRFHLVSPAGLVLNVFLWIPITVALLAGFGVLLLGWLLPPLATLCGWVCAGSLWVLESCVRLVQPMAGSHFWVAGPPLWWVVGFYGLLAMTASLPALWSRGKHSLGLIAVWIALGVTATHWPIRNSASQLPELRCTFVAVGHGTCVLLELPNGENLLYDAGSLGSPHLPVNTISSVLWSRGIGRLDAVVLSHADADHYNAVPGLLERFPIGAVYVSPSMFSRATEATEALRRAITDADTPLYDVHRGVTLPHGEPARMRVLHPPQGAPGENDNAGSVVLDVEFAGRHIILPGDIEDSGLEMLLRQKRVPCDVALAPHHGSPHSDPTRFTEWCSPGWIIISGGQREEVETVTSLFQKAGTRVLHTAAQGAVTVVLSRRTITVQPWCPVPAPGGR
jgi:competence protein ComEC